jgi:hypothetical protein
MAVTFIGFKNEWRLLPRGIRPSQQKTESPKAVHIQSKRVIPITAINHVMANHLLHTAERWLRIPSLYV